jgi:hypothetical protein
LIGKSVFRHPLQHTAKVFLHEFLLGNILPGLPTLLYFSLATFTGILILESISGEPNLRKKDNKNFNLARKQGAE